MTPIDRISVVGGNYNGTASSYPAAHRWYTYLGNGGVAHGFRVALYL